VTIQLKSWKTTACGLITALAGFILFSPETFQHWPWAISLAKYITLGGFAALGLASKDSTEHSTQAEVTKATVDQAAVVKAETEAVDLHAGGK
jgi:hypothetical protein